MSIQRLKIVPVNNGDFSDSWLTQATKIDNNFVELYKRFTPQVISAVVGGLTVWDMNSGGYAQLLMGAGNTTVSNPLNTFNGGMFAIEVVQDSVGSRTITWGSNFVWTAATAPTLTTTASKRDIIYFTCANGLLYGGQTILNLA